MEQFDLRELSDGIALKVKVQPRSSRNKISGVSADCLKIQLMSPPVDGAANEDCISFFADKCKVAKSNIRIISGKKNRIKIIKISGISREIFLRVFLAELTI